MNNYSSTKKAIKSGYPEDKNQVISRISNIDQDHYNLLKDSYENINKKCFKSIFDAYNNQIMTDGAIQIYAEDIKTPLATTISTYATAIINPYLEKDVFISEGRFNSQHERYYLLNDESQKYVAIKITAGVNSFKDGYVKNLRGEYIYDSAYILIFSDGGIYIKGEDSFNKIPIDICAKIFDECIYGINGNETNSFIPSVIANIYYKLNNPLDIYDDDAKKYYKKHEIRYPKEKDSE